MNVSMYRDGNGVKIGGTGIVIGAGSFCECGQRAVVISFFTIKPLKGGQMDKDREPIGALALCSGCAVDMVEQDVAAWQWNKNANLCGYIGIREAIATAATLEAPLPVTWRNRERYSGKWKEVLEWIAGEGAGATAEQVVERVRGRNGGNYDSVYARLQQLRGKGVLRGHGSGHSARYWKKEEA